MGPPCRSRDCDLFPKPREPDEDAGVPAKGATSVRPIENEINPLDEYTEL